jgi:hypothetical protein
MKSKVSERHGKLLVFAVVHSSLFVRGKGAEKGEMGKRENG